MNALNEAPYRIAPPQRSRFFVSSNGEAFVDLDVVTVAMFRHGDNEDSEVEFWSADNAQAADGWMLHDDEARDFMRALSAYRRGDP